MVLAISSTQALVLSHRSRPWRTPGGPATGLHTLCPDSFLWTKSLLDGYTPLKFYPPLGVIKAFVVVNNWEDKPFPFEAHADSYKVKDAATEEGQPIAGEINMRNESMEQVDRVFRCSYHALQRMKTGAQERPSF